MWTVVLGVEAGSAGSSRNNPDDNREWLEGGLEVGGGDKGYGTLWMWFGCVVWEEDRNN